MNNINYRYHLQIPGIQEFTYDGTIPNGILLLAGPAGIGKTMYCRQFLVEGLRRGDQCMFISSNLTEKQSKELLYDQESYASRANLICINPFPFTSSSKRDVETRLSHTLGAIQNAVEKLGNNTCRNDNSIRIVIDSLTHMRLNCTERQLIRFIANIAESIKEKSAIAICTLATSEKRTLGALGSMTEGIMEMKFRDHTDQPVERLIRLLSAKGVPHKINWIKFRISNDNGELIFGDRQSSPSFSVAPTCTLCGKPVIGTPHMELDLVFDSSTCIETYRKLVGAYGSSLSETGLPMEAFSVSFFFIDIVGLSDPTLSVRKQVQKIEVLNRNIAACDSFKKAKDKRIILPTGDGMAIGFLLNPELPLQLALELHGKLRRYNREKSKEDRIGVRIGLASGPVFTVTDINNIQNVWGPGIILARRVMDAGDEGHILLADKFADELIALKEEYKSMIRPICKIYEIKHGQRIALYSAHSIDFGNPELPAKILQAH